MQTTHCGKLPHNIYKHIFNLDLELKSSGLSSIRNSNKDAAFQEVKKRMLMGGDLGLGIDMGFTYQINKQWYVDASLLDVGFINHTKDVENYSVKGTYEFEGIDPFFTEFETGQSADEYWSKIEESGIDEIYFAWIGSYEIRKPNYYIINGPDFIIEYDNAGFNNDGNHIHSIWREKGNDFGEDILKTHYLQHKH